MFKKSLIVCFVFASFFVLAWCKSATVHAAITDIIMDNSDTTGVTIVPGIMGVPASNTTGWTLSTSKPDRIGDDYLTTNTNTGEWSVTYRPTLPEDGLYDVSVFYNYGASRATNVPVDIYSADGKTTVIVDQTENYSEWYSLGTFRFTAGTDGYVVIRNDGINSYVTADGVKFGPPGGNAIVPTADLTPGPVTMGSTVQLSSITVSSTVYYTTDGTNPTNSATVQKYTAPIVINKDTTIQAYTAAPGMTNSGVKTFVYTLLKPAVTIDRHKPSNLFAVNQDVIFNVHAVSPVNTAQIASVVTDYFGNTVVEQVYSAQLTDGKLTLPVNLGKLPLGYYELNITETSTDYFGNTATGTQKVTFGVAEFVERTAAEHRDGGYRFGLKIWYYGVPTFGTDRTDWDEKEVVAASTELGLQWTRALFNETVGISTVDLINQYDENVILKVERFPASLYDTARYGPMKEWEAKYGAGAWVLKTLPMELPYKEWLRGELLKLPASSNIYEIWNEPWDKLSPQDFATLCGWIVEVVKSVNPNAIIGPNLYGSTSQYQFDAQFIAAGGMNGMTMVALHPYGASEDRAMLRSYKQWLHDQVGYDVDLYVTEFGSHSTPQGPAARSEHEQAQRVVRQALALYAEDVKAFTAHWMGGTEQDPTYIEDWFGFFHFNYQPKPALIAYANAARLIDASRYVGDLWYGPGSDEMLFERNGTYTLALGTKGETKEVEVSPGVKSVTLVDMVGNSTVLQVPEDGKLKLTLGPDYIYLVGVSPELEKQASKELIPERWPKSENPARKTRIAKKFNTAPVLDGNLGEWNEMTQLALLNSKVNPADDCSAMGYIAYDDQNLYIAIDVRDNEILNVQPRATLYKQDNLEIFFSTESREEGTGYGPQDHQLFISPTSGEGRPIIAEVTDRSAGVVVDIPGAQYFSGKAGNGWRAEVAIPWTYLKYDPQSGIKMAMEMKLSDADTSHERFKLDEFDGMVNTEDPTSWSYLILDHAIPVTGVNLNHSSLTLNIGDTSTLTATVTPENATNKNVTWSSNNEAVASVVNGVVTAKAAGTAIIKAISVADAVYYADCTVTVNSPVSSGDPSYSGDGGTQQNSGGLLPVHVDTKTGTPTVTLMSEIDRSTGTATAVINTATLEHAFSQAKANEEGVKVVVIQIPKVEGAKAYEPVLPANAVTGAATDRRIELKTEVADLVIYSNMLKESDAAHAANISLEIAAADKSTLDTAIKAAVGDRPVIELSIKADGKTISWSNPDAPVTVSLPYKAAPAELKNPEHIVVWYIDGAGKAAAVPSGKYDPATETVTFTTTHFAKYAVNYVVKTFEDITGYDWAKKQIEVLASKGVIAGTAEKTFTPAASVTRADFLLMLVKTLGLSASFESNFEDVSKTDYYYDAVGIARKLGITEGTGNSLFAPKAQISRQDMITLSARALRFAKKLNTAGDSQQLGRFSDSTSVEAYAAESIAAMVKEGIVEGNGDTLNPRGNATRAETAVLMYRLYNK